VSRLVGPTGAPLMYSPETAGCVLCGAPNEKVIKEQGFGGHVHRVCLECGADAALPVDQPKKHGPPDVPPGQERADEVRR